MLIENRRSYRLPFRNKIILGTNFKIYAGSAVNISVGGLFISISDLSKLSTGEECSCVFQLEENTAPLKLNAVIKRLNRSNSNPNDEPGVGIQFYKNSLEVLKPLREYIQDLRKDYEALSTVLDATEPELRSLLPIVKRLHIHPVENLAELKNNVDQTIMAIEHVEKKYGVV